MTAQDYQALDAELRALLTWQAPPLAITFCSEAPDGVLP
jgi:hypothetical protein